MYRKQNYQLNVSGLFDKFLSWNFFAPLGKLSYTGYLIHYIFINIYIYNRKVQPYFTHLTMVSISNGFAYKAEYPLGASSTTD